MSQRQCKRKRQRPRRVRPLPRPNPFSTTEQGPSHTAYQMCLHLEDRQAIVRQSEETRLSVLVCARFLGYMLVEAITETGRQNVAAEIISSVDDDQLQNLAETHKNYFILCCKSCILCSHDPLILITPIYSVRSNKGRTPASSSAASFGAQMEDNIELSQGTPQSHSAAKAQVCAIVQHFCSKGLPSSLH